MYYKIKNDKTIIYEMKYNHKLSIAVSMDVSRITQYPFINQIYDKISIIKMLSFSS